jgi:hypothetical protein
MLLLEITGERGTFGLSAERERDTGFIDDPGRKQSVQVFTIF